MIRARHRVADRPKVTIERTFQASIEEVWALWTTKEGLEAWWAPEGWKIAVRDLDLRPGGEFVYELTATDAEQIDFNARSGIPLTHVHHIVYTEVEPRRRLAYKDVVDFVAGVAPYGVDNLIEFEEIDAGVRMALTFGPMHSDEWTRLASLGWESLLLQLEALLASRS
ncbi:MAG TPA: SRPBCC domain-containing protein [Candidatus Dormibacteraeota bacterium]